MKGFSLWPLRKANPGRELAKMRNPDKRKAYKAFHDAWRAEQGKTAILWSDGK